jgi:hypothetical protein
VEIIAGQTGLPKTRIRTGALGHSFAAVALFLVCSILYFITRSPALDEWDSVQFALGVGDFNLWRHQPHPPGYPVYIAFGWLASHAFSLSVPTALALGSALGGGLFVACWFLLIARRFTAAVAMVSALSLATLLITWMTATKVLTDALEAGLIALALLVLDGTAKSKRRGMYLAAGAIVAALAAGVRPQNTGIVLLILVLCVWENRAIARRWVRRRMRVMVATHRLAASAHSGGGGRLAGVSASTPRPVALAAGSAEGFCGRTGPNLGHGHVPAGASPAGLADTRLWICLGLGLGLACDCGRRAGMDVLRADAACACKAGRSGR